jgi:hypothetical protein
MAMTTGYGLHMNEPALSEYMPDNDASLKGEDDNGML